MPPASLVRLALAFPVAAFLLLLADLPHHGRSSEAATDAVPVTVTAARFAPLMFGLEDLGGLEFRGGLALSSTDRRFGGFSSLALSADGTALLAVSDEGWWFRARLSYTDGRPSGLSDAALDPMLGKGGRRPKSKAARDAEALALARPGDLDGKVYVGFESRPQVSAYDLGRFGMKAKPEPVRFPAAIGRGPANGELEALARWSDGPDAGAFIAVSESNFDAAGNIRAWIFGGSNPRAFTIARYEDYKITDIALLPGGDVVTVERSYATSIMPGMAIRRFPTTAIRAGTLIEPKLLFAGRQPFYAIDNMEGIAFHRVAGEDRISVISDDNYSPEQRTVLYQFALRD